MENQQFLFTLFCTVFFCLGWNMSLGEHNVFHFIRKPFINLYDNVQNLKELYKTFEPNRYQRDALLVQRIGLFILTPLILCITCMASIWGIAVFVTLNGLTSSAVPYLIINCLAASFIQTFIWNIYDRISNQ